MKKFAIIAAIIGITFFIVFAFFAEPRFDNPFKEIDYAKRIDRPLYALRAYESLLKKDSLNPTWNRGYVLSMMAMSRHSYEGSDVQFRDAYGLEMKYRTWLQSGDPHAVDIANYSLGLMQAEDGTIENALLSYEAVTNKALKHLNSSIGDLYLNDGNFDKAEEYYKRELSVNGDKPGAWKGLARLYYFSGKTRLADLMNLLKNPESSEYCPRYMANDAYMLNGNFGSYVTSLLGILWYKTNIIGFLAAGLILVVWLLYLVRIDIFEREKWTYILLTVLMGIFFSLLVHPISDFDRLFRGHDFDGKPGNDFVLYVLRVGLVEETVKIIPFLIIWKFTRAANEPIDFLVYPAAAALGFAFAENLLYFQEHQLYIIHARALISVVFHMVLSSIIGYGLAWNHFVKKRNPVLPFLAFLLTAALVHGTFDFGIDSGSLYILLGILLPGILLWNLFINNLLNNSNFYSKAATLDIPRLQTYLQYSLVAIFAFEFLSEGWLLGPTATRQNLFQTGMGLFMMGFIPVSLSSFDIVPKYWMPVSIPLFGMRIRFAKGYFNAEGLRYRIMSFREDSVMEDICPIAGAYERTLDMRDSTGDWFLITLDNPFSLEGKSYKKLVMTPKDIEDPLGLVDDVIACVMLIPDESVLGNESNTQEDFEFIDWGKVSPDVPVTEAMPVTRPEEDSQALQLT